MYISMQSAILTKGSDCQNQQHWGGGEGKPARVRRLIVQEWTSRMDSSVIGLVGQHTAVPVMIRNRA